MRRRVTVTRVHRLQHVRTERLRAAGERQCELYARLVRCGIYPDDDPADTMPLETIAVYASLSRPQLEVLAAEGSHVRDVPGLSRTQRLALTLMHDLAGVQTLAATLLPRQRADVLALPRHPDQRA